MGRALWLALLLVGISIADAYGATITVGQPLRGGTDTFVVTELGDIRDTSESFNLAVGASDTSAAKAQNLANLIDTQSAILSASATNNVVTVTGPGSAVTIAGIALTQNQSGESDIAFLPPTTGPLIGTLRWLGQLSPVDDHGVESRFRAFLGSESLTAFADIGFHEIAPYTAGQTTAGDLVWTLGDILRPQLPSALQPFLTVDRSQGSITFLFPAGDPFIQSFTSSPTTEALFSLEPPGVSSVPEPSALALLGFGLLAQGVVWVRRRRA
jgi:PEP-CTERM motif-containing protein